MGNIKWIGIAVVVVAVIGGAILLKNNTSKTSSGTSGNGSANNAQQNLLGKDVCSNFSKDFVASVIGQPVVRTSAYDHGQNFGCEYFISTSNVNQMVMIDINYGSVENQKAGNKYMFEKVEKDNSIPMDNFNVWQKNNVLNKTYLVIDPNTFIIINRSGADVLTTDKMIAFAAAVAKKVGGSAGSSVSNSSPTLTTAPTQEKKTVVPLPQETDIVRSFFNLINEHRAADAVSMLDSSTIQNDSQKQAWAVQFNAFSKLTVSSIEPIMQDSWSDTQHEYKVTMDVAMKPEAASAAIPNYGYDNGKNVRFITITKVGSAWKILGIATGP